MIFTIFFTIIYLIFSSLLALLPTAGLLPTAVSSSMQYIFSLLWNFDYIISVPTLYIALGLVLSFEIAIVLWHAIHWLLGKIPFLHLR